MTSLTGDSIALTVCGIVYVPFPAGSYEIRPDSPIVLEEVLTHALQQCGLADRTGEVLARVRGKCLGAFAQELTRLEALRREVEEI